MRPATILLTIVACILSFAYAVAQQPSEFQCASKELLKIQNPRERGLAAAVEYRTLFGNLEDRQIKGLAAIDAFDCLKVLRQIMKEARDAKGPGTFSERLTVGIFHITTLMIRNWQVTLILLLFLCWLGLVLGSYLSRKT